MEEYLCFMYETYVISSQKNTQKALRDELLSLKQVDLAKFSKKVISQQFNIIYLLLAKGIITYSPSNMHLQLSVPNLLVYQRIHKLQRFAQIYLQKDIAIFVNEFLDNAVENGMGFPLDYEKRKIEKFLTQVQPSSQKQHKGNQLRRNKRKMSDEQKTQKYNYSKLIYEYKNNIEKTQAQQIVIQDKEKSIKKSGKNQKNQLKNNKAKQSKKADQNTTTDLFMLNIEQLTRLMRISKFAESYLSEISEKPAKSLQQIEQFFNITGLQSVIERKRYEKIQENINQVLGSDCLLIFNLLKKYPFITEKQLIKFSLLDIIETRKALSKLVQSGLAYFYHQNARTIVYKVSDWDVIEKKFMDKVCQSLTNLYILSDSLSTQQLGTQANNKQKMLQIESEIDKLDDILLIMGFDKQTNKKVSEFKL